MSSVLCMPSVVSAAGHTIREEYAQVRKVSSSRGCLEGCAQIEVRVKRMFNPSSCLIQASHKLWLTLHRTRSLCSSPGEGLKEKGTRIALGIMTLIKIVAGRKKENILIPEYISNDALTLEMIPPGDALWHDIALFSLTFSGYQKAGSFNRCTEVAHSRSCSTLSEIRACLYFEQRRWTCLRAHPDSETMEFVYGLLDKMREKIINNERD
jgi:hypothetical protein